MPRKPPSGKLDNITIVVRNSEMRGIMVITIISATIEITTTEMIIVITIEEMTGAEETTIIIPNQSTRAGAIKLTRRPTFSQLARTNNKRLIINRTIMATITELIWTCNICQIAGNQVTTVKITDAAAQAEAIETTDTEMIGCCMFTKTQ